MNPHPTCQARLPFVTCKVRESNDNKSCQAIKRFGKRIATCRKPSKPVNDLKPCSRKLQLKPTALGQANQAAAQTHYLLPARDEATTMRSVNTRPTSSENHARMKSEPRRTAPGLQQAFFILLPSSFLQRPQPIKCPTISCVHLSASLRLWDRSEGVTVPPQSLQPCCNR